MILIIHGNDIEKSRNYFFEEKNKLDNTVLINPDLVTVDLLFQTSENKNFFEKSTTVIVENFFSKIKANSSDFKEIASYINKNKTIDIIFWENAEVSKPALTAFSNATVKNFSLPQNLFLFLDNIKPQNSKYLITLFHELLKTIEVEIVMFMIIRQFRLLISQLDSSNNTIDEVKRMAPWQLSKFKKQLSYYDKNKLLNSYNKLFEIDLKHKTGKISFPLEKSIDFFLVDL
nr:hypothetical protein [Candidatus Levybacteria bacterium]